jgi:hypothetical protein
MSTEEQLNLFAEDSPVSHSVSPGSNSAQKMTAHSGLRCCELYGKWLPDGSLARMFLESSQWNSTRCYLTWKGKATPAGRLYFQLVPSTPTTEGIESGLLHTPTATANQMAPSMQKHVGSWWRTPSADQGGTPKALLEGKTTRPSGHKIQIRLQDQVRMWPTPVARDWKDTINQKDRGIGSRDDSKLPVRVFREEPEGTTGQLNPTWVEWLMGFPIGHTDLKPSETP